MQRLFAEATDWHTPWMSAIAENVEALAEAMAERTIFTRFVPATRSAEAAGSWRRYYERWQSMTLERLDPAMVELLPRLARLVPPARVVDKRTYSPWFRSALPALLERERTDTILVSGGESDICVLATVLGAIDRGYRVILITDALCSSADETYDASMVLYENRFGQQVETITTDYALHAIG
jgi:nicotinamidase-related amidase